MDYVLTLKSADEVASGTRMFTFGKPDGYEFEAGQYVALRLDETRLVAPDERGGVRSFSIASAPDDPDLQFVMREGVTGFKKTMWDLVPGDCVGCTKAVGHCTIPEGDERPIAILAGGVGIAPARAILRDAVSCGDTRPYILFYANRHREDAAFHEDLTHLDLPRFTYVWTLSECQEPVTESCEERGYITASMIRKYLPNAEEARYYVIGAPGFATAMKTMLLDMGIAETEIKVDPFTGLTGPATAGK